VLLSVLLIVAGGGRSGEACHRMAFGAPGRFG
jgi:hypothetical protein